MLNEYFLEKELINLFTISTNGIACLLPNSTKLSDVIFFILLARLEKYLLTL